MTSKNQGPMRKASSAAVTAAVLVAAAMLPRALGQAETTPADAATTSAPTATGPAVPATTATAPAATLQAGTVPSVVFPPTTAASRPFNGNARVAFNFKEATVDAVLDYLSESLGFIVIKEERITARVTVTSKQPVSADEAVDLLNTVLRPLNYTAIRTERVLRIVARDKAKKANIPVRFGSDPSQIKNTDELITQVLPLGSVDAVKLKNDLQPMFSPDADVTANAGSNTIIITDSSASIRRIAEIIAAMDRHQASTSDIKVFQLQYASAAAAAKLIADVFKPDEPGGGQQIPQLRRFFGGGPGGFGPQPGGAGDQAGAGGRGGKVIASADERTNTLVVTGPKETLVVVERVVKELDSNPTEERGVFVYPLRNGQAKRLEGVLNSLFGVSTGATGSTLGTQGRTGAGSYQRTTGGASPFGGAGGRTGGTTGGSRTGGTGGFGTGGFGSTFGNQPRTGGTFFGGGTGGLPGANLSAAARAAVGDLAGQVYVVADEDTNALLVTTSPKFFDRVKAILAELDRPAPQVLIKVLIAEVTHDNGSDIGLEMSYVNTRLNGMGTKIGTDFGIANSTGGLAISMLEGDFRVALRALATAGKLDVLSRPYILASDNQLASILVGQEVPFITNTRITDNGQTINTVQYQDVGIILNVTPHINPDGKVIMDVAPEISALTSSTVTISTGVTAPIFDKRSAQSRVAIDNGRTIVIGGLMEDRKTMNEEKVPLLGDIPVLGELFKRKKQNKTKTELLIFLTPHVAMDSTVLPGMSKDEMKGTKIVPNAVAPGTFQQHMEGMQRGATTHPGVPIYEPPTTMQGPSVAPLPH